jgi:hypothetical protein
LTSRRISPSTFVEQIPGFRRQEGLTGHLLGGWELSGTYNIASGQPYTPIQYGLDYYGSQEFRITPSMLPTERVGHSGQRAM